ncbi:MAG: amidohydrolase [Burkholderiales bacterium]|nr:amidohydrolase [Burkholderiales bacterium]
MSICIDAHSHFLPASILDLLRRDGARYGTPVQVRDDGRIFVITPERPWGPIGPGFYDLDFRRRYLAGHGISTQVLTPPPFLFYYWADPQASYGIIRAENDAIAEIVNGSAGRFAGLGTVPMHDAKLALRECDSIKRSGLCGVEIGSNVNGVDLDDERFWPIFEALESLGLAVLIHPHNVVGSDRMREFHLQNLVGFPADTTLAAARLVFSGVLDRFPNLKLCLGQAGGFLPYIMGRLDRGFAVRPECRRALGKPSEYLRRFYYDTIIHGPGPLAFLIETVGADRVMLGSDFPFDMELSDPRADWREQPRITEESGDWLRHRTACAFFGMGQAQDRFRADE